MLEPFSISMLEPGDCILYRPTDIFDDVVALKTFTRVSHVEVYIGDRFSVASRNGQGVDKYPVRETDVAAVRRPCPGFDLERAMHWFYFGNGTEPKAQGQKYGWRTLLTFAMLNHNPIEGHMICSEFAAEFFKAGGNPVFAKDYPSYRVPPSYFIATRQLATVWDDGRLFS